MKSPQVTKPRFALEKRLCSGCIKLERLQEEGVATL